MSPGKVNYCLNRLVEKGSLKINNFRNSHNELAYAYLLTPKGIESRTRMTVEFLQIKMREYERLKDKIEALRHEVKEGPLTERGQPDDDPETGMSGAMVDRLLEKGKV